MTIQDEFISTVSHELRTPLTSIRGFSQTLLSSWDKIDDENKKKFIKIIEEQSNRLINLVENILTVSKNNSGINVMQKVSIHSIIDKTLLLIKERYKTHKFSFVKKKDLPFALGDEDKLQQVFMNLLDNASKYSEPGSTVFVETGIFQNMVSVKITDEGVGIKKEDYDKLYKKFSRLENHLTSKTQGNGLGLYITKQIINSMKGNISFESTEGKGTTFEVQIPIYNEEDALKCSQKS